MPEGKVAALRFCLLPFESFIMDHNPSNRKTYSQMMSFNSYIGLFQGYG